MLSKYIIKEEKTMNKTKLFLLSFISMNVLMTCPQAMDLPQQDQHTTQHRIFSSGKELVDFSNQLQTLTVDKKYDEAFRLIPECLVITYAPIILSDMESFQFSRFFALAVYHKKRAEKSTLDFSMCVEENLKAIDHLEEYMNFSKDLKTAVPTFQKRLIDHRAIIYKMTGNVYAHLGTIHIPSHLQVEKNEADKAKKFFKISLSYLAKANDFIPFMSTSQAQDIFKDCRLEIITVCQNLIILSSFDESNRYLKMAKDINKEFKSPKTMSLFKKNVLELKQSERLIEGKRIIDQPKASKKIQQLRDTKLQNLNAEILQEGYKTIDFNDDSLMPKTKVSQIFNHCIHYSKTMDTPQVMDSLGKMESIVADLLNKADKPAQLLDIYRQLELFIGTTTFHKEFKSVVIATYLKTGQIKECLERLTVLADLEAKKIGNISHLTRFFLASVPCLMGDYTKWGDFDAEMKQIVLNAQLEKEQKKEKQLQQRAEKIRNAQSLAQENDLKKSEQKMNKVTKNDTVTTPIETINEQSVDYDFAVSPDNTANRKALRIQRHEEAIKQRAEKSTQEVKTSVPVIKSVSPQKVLTEETGDVGSIKDLYKLTRTAKFVDEQIEGGTWQFTREELINYFTSIGCVAKEGGRHKKLSLPNPKASIIMKGETVVAVLNDIEGALTLLGGALTLPRWDKSFNNGTVPHYLRDQILEARRKLVLLKVQENSMEQK